MITNSIVSLPSNCMVILKPPKEPCPESVLSPELAERACPEPAEGSNNKAQELLSQSVSQFKNS